MMSGLKKTKKVWTLDPCAGANINSCVKEAVAHARLTNSNVTIVNFNGIDILVTPKTKVSEAMAFWDNATEARSEAYRNSPEARKAEVERVQELQRCQIEVEKHLRFVPSNLNVLVPWLASFAAVADHIGVKYDKNALIAKLESYGFVANAHVTKNGKGEAWPRQKMGEYIVGQAIKCLKGGLPPHPSLTIRFAKEYEAAVA